MEENIVRVNEIEEIEPDVEIEEAYESSSNGALVAGIVGGFLAYAAIGGIKKLTVFAQTKWAKRKQKKEAKTVIDAEYAEVSDEQDDSEGEDTAG